MENMQEENEEKESVDMANTSQEKPFFLKVLLIISFIGGGMTSISYFFAGLLHDKMQLFWETEDIPEYMLAFEDKMMSFLSLGKAYFFITSLFAAISIVGVVFMWKMKKTGFYLYSIAQVALLALPLYYLGREGAALGDIMFTALFVAFYALNMKKFN